MSDLYELPNGWKWKTFDEVSNFIRGITFKPNERFDEPNENTIFCFRTTNIQSKLDDSDLLNIDSSLVKSDDKIVRNGDILISSANSRELLGKCCLVSDIDYKATLGGFIVCGRPNKNVLDTKYYYYYFSSDSNQNRMRNLANKTTGIANLPMKKVEKQYIPLPPLSEQQRIVSKLDKLFEKIDKSIALHQKNMDETDGFMGSVLNDVFGELEEKYDITTLDTLSSFQNGFAFKSKEFNTDGLGLRVIRIGNVLDIEKNPVFIDERKEFERFLLKENDIVISMTGTREKKDYLFVRVVDSNDSYLNQRVGKISNKDNSNHRYLYYYLQSNYFRDKIFEFETGTVNQGNISGKDIMNSKIPNIPLLIQQKVVKYLDEISEKIEKVKSAQKEKMDSLKALKASILDKAFRGEL